MTSDLVPPSSTTEDPPTGAPSRPVVPRDEPAKKRRRQPSRAVVWALLIFVTVVFMYPFAWLVSASLKPRSDVFDNKLVPETVTLSNFATVWQEAPIGVWLWNSIVIAVLAAVTVAITSALVAWGFSYFKFRGRDALFTLVLATMMLPGAVTMIPQFLIWSQLGFVGADAPMKGMVPMWAMNLFGSAFYIFLLRQFFLGLPKELFEAARVDGASNWRIFWQMVVPLSKPALIVTLLFELQASWSELMRALIYLQSSEQFTVPRGLKALVNQFGFGGEWHWEIIVTASVITTVPMIILFFLGQKQFVDGIATTGRKG
ncbi:carbohydrate ABC transporter permease [Oerskovia sp. KBS0722]|uniref:carbohydrate ABC transporter permease n=1 Tax=Oerskovia sp. KBS0722 TaxID=1179673 RepID=UPI001FED76DD|nr:carbohydrate ABC transporter permease [Oerskovia sp. KBS0722]